MSFWTRPSGVALIYAVIALAWIFGSGALLALAVPDPELAARIEVFKGAAFVVVTSLLLCLLLRSRDAASRPVPSPAAAAATGRRTVLLLAVMTLGAPLVATGFYILNRAQMERGRLDDLNAIAGLKAGQLAAWLEERRSDAATLTESLGFVERVTAMLEAGAERERERVRDRLAAMQRQYLYEAVSLLDVRGNPVLTLGIATEMDSRSSDLLPAAFATGEVQGTGLYRDRSGRVRLDFVAPLLALRGGTYVPVGAVVLGEDAESALFPLVAGWPGASRSGEVFLVRRDGDALAYLTGLRHRDGAALLLHGAPGEGALPTAAAIRDGRAGTIRGVDYRGVGVLAAYAPVAGTDWFLIVKEDLAEALAPVRQLALWVGLMTFIALAVVTAVMLVLQRTRQHAEHLALLAQADRQRKLFFELPFIGMAMTDPETKRWVQFNDRLCEIFGYSREELAARTWAEMTHPDDLGKDMAEFERVLHGESEGYVLDKRFIRSDGAVVDTTIDVKCVRNAAGGVEHLVCMVQDVTERRLAEERVLNASRLYATLSRCNHAIVHSAGEEALFVQVCRAAVESAGMKMAWIGITDANGLVQPVARFGPGAEYLDGIRISVHGDDPHGCGPTGTAIRENRPYWCQDFLGDTATAPWHERGARFGWGASAALPLRRGAACIGALMLYAARPRAFDAQTRTLLLEMAQDISFALDNFERERSRRRADDTARALTEQLSFYLEASPAVSYALTLDGSARRTVWVSANVARMTGYEVAEAMQPDWWERHLHPEDAGACQAVFRAALAGQPEPRHEYRFRHRDGHYLWVMDTFRVVRDAGGRPVQVVGAWLDVSGQRQLQESLLASQERFRAMAEQSLVGVYTLENGVISYVNPRTAEIFGYAPEEMVGRPPEDFIDAGDVERVRENIRRRLAGDTDSLQIEYGGRRKDGSTVMIGVHGGTAVIGGQRVLLGVLQDITEKLRAEAAIRDYVARIEHMLVGTVDAISSIVELRDPFTAGHQRRVGDLSAAIAAEMGLDEDRQRGLRLAGAVHDVGKIAVPAEILSKPGRLTSIEFDMVKAHAQRGYDVLRGIESPWPLAEIARQHHERMDGSGYPRGLKGTEILLEARILAVADVVEAMASHRPYRATLGIDEALLEIERHAGTLYDADAAGACLRLFRDRGYALPD